MCSGLIASTLKLKTNASMHKRMGAHKTLITIGLDVATARYLLKI